MVPFGELDVTSASTFAEWVWEQVETVDGDVHLDLRHVHFISAAAITVLLELDARLLMRGRRLELTQVDPFVGKVLEVCHLRDLWSPDPLPAS